MTGITFEHQKNGYDKTQVDKFIEGILWTYKMVYKDYETMCSRYYALFRRFKRLERRGPSCGSETKLSNSLITRKTI